MKRFRFSLQPVAVLRAHRELRAQEAFGHAMQAFHRAEAEHAAVQRRVAQLERVLAADRQGTFAPAEQLQALAAYRQERVVEHSAERAVANAHNVVNQRRAEYLDAHRNVEVVKRLEQKARTAHQIDCGREEQAAFDDFAARRASRGRSHFSP